MRLLLATWIALLICASAAPTASHTFPVERSAVLQVHTSHVELLLLYAEPPGPRTERILALYDANQNGEIDGVEQRLARRIFMQRAFYGLDISFNHQSAKKTADIRYKRTAEGGISVAILQRIDLIVDSNELTVSLALTEGETIPPIEIIVEPVGWKLVDDDAGERKVALQPGTKTAVRLTRAPTPATEAAPPYRPNLPE